MAALTIDFATSEADLAVCRTLRRTVFIEEQGVSEADEVDGLDDTCLHVLAREGDDPIGAARVHIQGGTAKIGRVCVLPPGRGRGIGGEIIGFILTHLRADPQITQAKLGSQIAAMSLYSRAGFRPVGERYMEAGLEHQDMEHTLE